MNKQVQSPLGTDPELNQAISLLLSSFGFETEDQDAIKYVEYALRKKMSDIIANIHLQTGPTDINTSKTLDLSLLKKAATTLKPKPIRIDRPDFFQEQPSSKMNTRRKK